MAVAGSRVRHAGGRPAHAQEAPRLQKCHVVAHSIGGLVSRAAITKAVSAEGSNFIPRFVSISTPWCGHAAAESGIRHLKKPVPSMIDVAPESDYLRSLYTTPLPKGTTHDLIYGSTKGGYFISRRKTTESSPSSAKPSSGSPETQPPSNTCHTVTSKFSINSPLRQPSNVRCPDSRFRFVFCVAWWTRKDAWDLNGMPPPASCHSQLIDSP